MSTSALARTSRWVLRSKTLLHFQTKLILTSFSTDTGTADKDNDPGRPGPPPIRVLLTESAGRGVFATRRIGAGELIHTAKPVVAHLLSLRSTAFVTFVSETSKLPVKVKLKLCSFVTKSAKNNLRYFDVIIIMPTMCLMFFLLGKI